ncbi:MAG: hypothetical protein PHX02_01620 [Oscillospiraceae bacterium]|jgi:hypothetical protein|nr:hypothetical protein [Oscillospiraceae bacterium]
MSDSKSAPDIEILQAQIAELKKLVGKQSNNAPQNTVPQSVLENEKRMQELVEVRLFKDNGKYRDDVFVAVNGKSFQIKRGVTVKVPRYVKEVLDSSLKQDEYAARYSEKMADEYLKSVR